MKQQKQNRIEELVVRWCRKIKKLATNIKTMTRMSQQLKTVDMGETKKCLSMDDKVVILSTVDFNGHRRVDEATNTKSKRRVGCSLVLKNKEAGNKHKDHDKNVSTVENSGHGRDEEVLVDG